MSKITDYVINIFKKCTNQDHYDHPLESNRVSRALPILCDEIHKSSLIFEEPI